MPEELLLFLVHITTKELIPGNGMTPRVKAHRGSEQGPFPEDFGISIWHSPQERLAQGASVSPFILTPIYSSVSSHAALPDKLNNTGP